MIGVNLRFDILKFRFYLPHLLIVDRLLLADAQVLILVTSLDQGLPHFLSKLQCCRHVRQLFGLSICFDRDTENDSAI